MIVPVLALAGILLPLLLGGDLRRFAGVRLRGLALLLVAFVVQVLVVSVLDGPRLLLEVVHVATYVAAAVVLWLNRRLPGLAALGAGAASNGVTIAVNGGTLPARAGALRGAGLTDDGAFANSAVLEHPRLAFLGDVFAIPAGRPLSNVFSVGDVLIVLGATWLSLAVCGTRWTRPVAAPGTKPQPTKSASRPRATPMGPPNSR